jgi:putative tricarboxylic transport membrane protein
MDMMAVFTNVLNPESLLLISVGVAIGTLFGAIPGLNTPIALALILPITFTMDVIPTICIIMGIYMGGVSGGLVSAIMLKIPGSSAALATTFDGYPMALQGRGTEALSIGVFASFFGGMFSSIALLTFAPFLAKLAIGFGPWEYFGTALLALSLSCVLIKGNMVKGFISMAIGVLATCVGMSPIDGIAKRFSFGSYNLENGFEMIAIIIAVFAMPEIISNTGKLKEKVIPVNIKKKIFYMLSWKEIKKYTPTFVRSSILGTILGILPGMGGSAASLMGYAQEKNFSKDPDSFGKGTPYGVAAPESANNATTGGALIPMLSLGVPGDINTSIILGSLTMQGIAAGPLLSLNHPVVFRTFIFAAFVANIFMLIIQSFNIRFLAKIIQVPKNYLLPVITVFCITGVVCLNGSVFDAYYTIAFAILGYILEKNGYSVAPLVIGFVLGGIMENGLRRAISYYGSFMGCMRQPSVGTLFVIIAFVFPVVWALMNRKKIKKEDLRLG